LETSNEKIIQFVDSFDTNTVAWEEYAESDEILKLRIPCGFHQHLTPFIEMTL